MWVSVCACVRVFALCFIPMAQSHHLRACISIEFIFGLDMNNKLVIINFVCYTVLSRLNLMWKCGNSRTHISYSHTTRHPHVLTLTLSLSASRFHFPSTFSDARWERLSDNLYTFVLFFIVFPLHLWNFKDSWMLFFSFVSFDRNWQNKTKKKQPTKKWRNKNTSTCNLKCILWAAWQ